MLDGAPFPLNIPGPLTPCGPANSDLSIVGITKKMSLSLLKQLLMLAGTSLAFPVLIFTPFRISCRFDAKVCGT